MKQVAGNDRYRANDRTNYNTYCEASHRYIEITGLQRYLIDIGLTIAPIITPIVKQATGI